MKKTIAIALSVILFLAVVYATGPKTYQVTGPVLDIQKDIITVQKDTDKWELQKNADTNIVGSLPSEPR